MRRRAPAVDFSHEEPPAELLRFATRASSPSWTADEFAAWLRARAAWRDTHSEPLPGLPGRERCALPRIGVPRALIDAETAASRGARSPQFQQSAVADRPASPVFSTSEEPVHG